MIRGGTKIFPRKFLISPEEKFRIFVEFFEKRKFSLQF